jgi:phosphonate transport system substrate-binding protein
MKLSYLVIASVLAIGVAAGCAAPTPQAPPESVAAPAVEGGKTLVIAELGEDAAKKTRRFQPLADHLAGALAPQGYARGEVQIVSGMDRMVAMLRNGEVDVVVDSPYPAMLIADRSGAQPILRRWKGGDSDYYGVVFAFAGRGMTSLADLEGRTIALETELSTSGYFLPVAELMAKNLKPVRRTTASESELGPREVGYLLTGDEDNTVQWVLTGKAAAGAIDRKTYADLPADVRARLIVLGETERVARHVVMVRPDLPPAVVAAIAAELTAMDTTEAGRTVLEAFEKTTRFDRFPAEASLERMRSLFLMVGPPR